MAEYVLLQDRFNSANGTAYVKGNTVPDYDLVAQDRRFEGSDSDRKKQRDEAVKREVKRLKDAGALGDKDSTEAKFATGELSSQRETVLLGASEEQLQQEMQAMEARLNELRRQNQQQQQQQEAKA